MNLGKDQELEIPEPKRETVMGHVFKTLWFAAIVKKISQVTVFALKKQSEIYLNYNQEIERHKDYLKSNCFNIRAGF